MGKNKAITNKEIIDFVLHTLEGTPISNNQCISSGIFNLQHSKYGTITIAFNRNSLDSGTNPGKLQYHIYRGKRIFKTRIATI